MVCHPSPAVLRDVEHIDDPGDKLPEFVQNLQKRAAVYSGKADFVEC